MGACYSLSNQTMMPTLRTRSTRPPKGSFPSVLDYPEEGSFPASILSSITTEYKKSSNPRKRTVPSYSMSTKCKFLKTCFKRRVHPSSPGTRSTFSGKIQGGASFEWAALTGSPSFESDEVPLMDFVDEEDRDGYYYYYY